MVRMSLVSAKARRLFPHLPFIKGIDSFFFQASLQENEQMVMVRLMVQLLAQSLLSVT
jgi:hypothetical protein